MRSSRQAHKLLRQRAVIGRFPDRGKPPYRRAESRLFLVAAKQHETKRELSARFNFEASCEG